MGETRHSLYRIFNEALERADPGDRAEYLAGACGEDSALRHQIEKLIRAHEHASDFLNEEPQRSFDSPNGEEGVTGKVASDEGPGTVIGRYKLLGKIGEGGFGVVYMAEQMEPIKRRVALKIIKLGMDTRQVVARFEAERQALAMMNHPGIAKVIDVGATDSGRPFFVMELVKGIPVTRYCNENQRTTRERLELFIPICQAIQHAHQKGVIHRDIKPSNIMITLLDGVPVPKVIDFGIAKATQQELTEKTIFTQYGQFVGTPAYMSPEQAEMSGLDIDTRSDVYSLGVVLYELITGTTPFDTKELLQSGPDAMRRILCEREPDRPSTRLSQTRSAEEVSGSSRSRIADYTSKIDRDLDRIVLKALEKDRSRRYETANGLASDIRRYLNHEPVSAVPPTMSYQLGKFYQKHRSVVRAVAAGAALLALTTAVSLWLAVRATRAEDIAVAQTTIALNARQEARLQQYVSDIKAAQVYIDKGNLGAALPLLSGYIPKSTEAEDSRGFEWFYLYQLAQGDYVKFLDAGRSTVGALAFSPDGKTLFSVSFDGRLTVWDWAKGVEIQALNLPKGGIRAISVSDDGRLVAVPSPDGLKGYRFQNARLQEFENQSLGRFTGGLGFLRGSHDYVAFDLKPGIAFVYVIDFQTSAIKSRIEFASDHENENMDYRTITSALSLDGTKGAMTVAETQIRLLSFDRSGVIASGSLFRIEDSQSVSSLCFSADATRLFVSHHRSDIWEFNLNSGKLLHPPILANARSFSIMSSGSGDWMVAASLDHTVKLWDTDRPGSLVTLNGHREEVWSVAVSSDSRWIATGGQNGEIVVWREDAGRTNESFDADSISNKESIVASSGSFFVPSLDGKLREYNLMSRNHSTTPVSGYPVDASPDSGSLTLAAKVSRTGRNTSILLETWKPGSWTKEASRAFNIDGNLSYIGVDHRNGILVVGNTDGKVFVIELSTGRKLGAWKAHDRPVHAIALSPDGRRMATVGGGISSGIDESPEIALWDMTTLNGGAPLKRELMDGDGHFRRVDNLAFSRDGELLFSSGADGRIVVWDPSTGSIRSVLRGHKQAAGGISLSPDGKTLVSAGDDGTLRFWNVKTERELCAIHLGGHLRGKPVFSESGEHLAVKTWDQVQGQEGMVARYLVFRAPRSLEKQ